MTIAISIKALHKTYDNGFEALKGINLDVKQGDFFALLGPNGAGKSTTIGVISTLVRKTRGEVQVFGKNVATHVFETKLELGIVPQEFNFNLFEKVRDIIITQAGYYGLPPKLAAQRSEKYLRLLGLWEQRNDVSRFLSGGMKRRLMIARALVHEPSLLILDEPTAGVDIELRRTMWDFLRDLNDSGTTIILTTHYLEEAESLCRNIAIIDEGNIVANTSMKKLLSQLDSQVLVFDSPKLLTAAPALENLACQLVDDHCFEVTVKKDQHINQIFDQLNFQEIPITSMRNKTNRLEQLFVSLLHKSL